jgi:hypothetical protein
MLIRVSEANDPMTPEALAAAQDLFAEIIARTFAREHPELLGFVQRKEEDAEYAGPCLHRCTGRALTPREDGPASSESEDIDDRATSTVT